MLRIELGVGGLVSSVKPDPETGLPSLCFWVGDFGEKPGLLPADWTPPDRDPDLIFIPSGTIANCWTGCRTLARAFIEFGAIVRENLLLAALHSAVRDLRHATGMVEGINQESMVDHYIRKGSGERGPDEGG